MVNLILFKLIFLLASCLDLRSRMWLQKNVTTMLSGLTLDFGPHIMFSTTRKPKHIPSQYLLPLIQITLHTAKNSLSIDDLDSYFLEKNRSNLKSTFFSTCISTQWLSLLFSPIIMTSLKHPIYALNPPSPIHSNTLFLQLLLHPLHHQSTESFPSICKHAKIFPIYK